MPNAWFGRNSRSEEGEAPPIWAMPAAIGLSLLMAVALVVYRGIHPAADPHRVQAAVMLPRMPPGTERVVAVGSSILGEAMLPDREMESLSRRILDRAIRYDSIVRPLCEVPDWPGLEQEILGARPAVLLLDAYCLFYESRARPARDFLFFWTSFESDVLRHWLTGRSAGTGLGPPARLRPAPMAHWSVRAVAELREYRRQRLRFGFRRSIGQSLARFRRAGIAVVILDVPLHPLVHVHGEDGTMAQELRALEVAGVASVARCAFTFDRPDFIDPMHLGGPGRARYSEWLARSLSGWLRRDLD
jgi:hypothetical protein